MNIESYETRYDGESWIREKFVRIPVTIPLLRWLGKKYGKPEYLKSYWIDWNDAIIAEKVYIHWRLVK